MPTSLSLQLLIGIAIALSAAPAVAAPSGVAPKTINAMALHPNSGKNWDVQLTPGASSTILMLPSRAAIPQTATSQTTTNLQLQQSPIPYAQSPQESLPAETTPSPAEQLNLDPAIIENSPVLQRWLQEIPDVRSEIRHDPSFRTRLRVGYSQFPSTDQASGFHVGVEDVFVGETGFTWSAEYQQSFDGDRQAYGSDLHYYILPLGSYVNVAPLVGYRHLETDEYRTDGVNLGLRLMLALSRTGAADISLTQSWVSPGANEEVGITTLSVGYALTHDLRISADLQKQNASQSKDSRIGIGLEWML
jgi:hypothetical protein